MYEEKIIPVETKCAPREGVPPCICEKAKRIHYDAIKAKEIAVGIQGVMFADYPAMENSRTEATCLDDELNGIYDEMQFLLECLLIVSERLSGCKHE